MCRRGHCRMSLLIVVQALCKELGFHFLSWWSSRVGLSPKLGQKIAFTPLCARNRTWLYYFRKGMKTFVSTNDWIPPKWLKDCSLFKHCLHQPFLSVIKPNDVTGWLEVWRDIAFFSTRGKDTAAKWGPVYRLFLKPLVRHNHLHFVLQYAIFFNVALLYGTCSLSSAVLSETSLY